MGRKRAWTVKWKNGKRVQNKKEKREKIKTRKMNEWMKRRTKEIGMRRWGNTKKDRDRNPLISWITKCRAWTCITCILAGNDIMLILTASKYILQPLILRRTLFFIIKCFPYWFNSTVFSIYSFVIPSHTPLFFILYIVAASVCSINTCKSYVLQHLHFFRYFWRKCIK